jgi:hypothetical protein
MAGRVLGIGMVEQVVPRVAVCIDGSKHGHHIEALQVGKQAAGGYVRLSDLLVFRRLCANEPVLLEAIITPTSRPHRNLRRFAARLSRLLNQASAVT